jgi:hypothetical protein
MRQWVVVCAIACLQAVSVLAQGQPGTIRVHVRAGDAPVGQADVIAAGAARQTDASGTAELQLAAGDAELTVVKSGYVSVTVKVLVVAGANRTWRSSCGPRRPSRKP